MVVHGQIFCPAITEHIAECSVRYGDVMEQGRPDLPPGQGQCKEGPTGFRAESITLLNIGFSDITCQGTPAYFTDTQHVQMHLVFIVNVVQCEYCCRVLSRNTAMANVIELSVHSWLRPLQGTFE